MITFDKEEIGLYLHFPFCVRKCKYCDFLSFSSDEPTKRQYAEAMIREIRSYGHALKDRRITSLFLGGGTPSVMPASALGDIFRVLYDTFEIAPDAEITMEVNPGTVNEPLMGFLYQHVNRVSMGVQSFVDEELKALGRIHTADEAVASYELLKASGIKHINLDLMSATPGQTEASWEYSLRKAVELAPEHISAYSLIVEEGTPFYAMEEAGTLRLPDEQTERGMYYRTKEILAEAGYHRYEISNYAKDGAECRHNVRYWRRSEYLGLGLGAASLFEGSRWTNTDRMEEYLKDSAYPERLIRDPERLELREEVEEFMFLGLRMIEGVSAAEFKRQFNLELRDVYGETLDTLVSQKLLAYDGKDCYALTERGIDVSNEVLAEFLMDE